MKSRLLEMGFLSFLLFFPATALADDAPISIDSVQYSWELSDPEVERLFEQIPLLRYSDAMSEVKNELGEPSREGSVADKKDAKKVSYILRYDIKLVKPGGGSGYDQTILLVFDEQRRLRQIGYSNLPPLSGKILWKSSSSGGVESSFTEPPRR